MFVENQNNTVLGCALSEERRLKAVVQADLDRTIGIMEAVLQFRVRQGRKLPISRIQCRDMRIQRIQ